MNLDELSKQLTDVGITGRRRSRILAEIADHLSCDPAAELGTPEQVARQFADELGTVRARRAAYAAFGALAIAGALSAAAFLAAPGIALRHASENPVAALGAMLATLGAQVALVAGLLAAVRAVRRRGEEVIPRAEAAVIVRRASTGLAAGMATMVGMTLLGAELIGHVASWWTTLAFISAGVGAAALAGAGPMVLRATRLRPVAAGGAGDLFVDLTPLVPRPLQGRPWRLALVVAGAVALALTAAGVLQADPYDGALRGLADGSACLAGFAVLGRYLGLKQS